MQITLSQSMDSDKMNMYKDRTADVIFRYVDVNTYFLSLNSFPVYYAFSVESVGFQQI